MKFNLCLLETIAFLTPLMSLYNLPNTPIIFYVFFGVPCHPKIIEKFGPFQCPPTSFMLCFPIAPNIPRGLKKYEL
jgi:hypothetical protein